MLSCDALEEKCGAFPPPVHDASFESPAGFLPLPPTDARAELPTKTSSCTALGTTETLERSTWKNSS